MSQTVYCEECYGSYPSAEYLEEISACADSEVGYSNCCYKYVCRNGCTFKCSQCLQIFNDVEMMFKRNYQPTHNICGKELFDLRDQIFICQTCVEKENIPKDDIEPAKLWYGISNEEWMRRYN